MRHDTGPDEAAAPAWRAEGQLDAGALLQALWRRKLWIAIPTLLALIASAAYVTLATPLYRSEARILIEHRETVYSRPDADRGADRERPLLDAEAVQSQVQLALSRDLARQVVREFKLAELPEFNPQSRSPMGWVMGLFGLARDPGRGSVEERVLDRYYARLSVFQIERSRVIGVEFRSADPDLAAGVANAVADGFLKLQQEAKHDAMRQASVWLASEIEEMRGRVAEAEARVEDFRGKSNLFLGSNNNPLSAQQLAELNSQIVLARSQQADAESRSRLIREMLKSGRPVEASDIVNSELIRRLNEQRVTLQAQLAEQSSTLLPQHPRIKELRAQIADLEAQSRVEAERLARSLENDSQIAAARLESLMASHDEMKKQAAALGTEDVQLRALEREAKAQRDLLESFLSRYRDVTARDTPDAILPDARIVSQAVPASNPYFPRRLPIVLLVTLATMISAMSLVAAGEIMSGGLYRSPASVAGVMPAALAPQAPASWIGTPAEPPKLARQQPPPEPMERQLKPLAEHLRGLGRGIAVVTGAGGEEPAPRVAVELARELGRQYARVLLVDFDVGNAPTAKLVADPRAAGLSDLLFGVANFGEVIQRDRTSRIHVVTTGRGVRDTASLLTAEKLAVVFGAVSQTYDHVIVAAPSLASLPGAERLARFSRALVLVTAEGGEGSGAAVSDKLAARGFSNVVVVTVTPETAPPGSFPDRAAA